jgi:hypothetical protein
MQFFPLPKSGAFSGFCVSNVRIKMESMSLLLLPPGILFAPLSEAAGPTIGNIQITTGNAYANSKSEISFSITPVNKAISNVFDLTPPKLLCIPHVFAVIN